MSGGPSSHLSGPDRCERTAYHAKYDRYGPAIAGHVTGPAAHAVTIRLIKAVR